MSLKVIIHIGMPKCGSTSIQNHLFLTRESLAHDHGIYYYPSSQKFPHHREISDLVAAFNNIDELKRLLVQQVESATADNCHTIFISSEDLFYLLERTEKIDFLARALREVGFLPDQISYVLVHRDLKKFYNSYLKQLVSNGSSLVDQDLLGLCDFQIGLIRNFFNLGGHRLAISLDQTKKNGGLLKVFIENIFDIPYDGDDRNDNTWGQRGFVSEIMGGQAVGLYAMNHLLSPNEPLADSFRSEIRDIIDRSAEVDEVGRFLHDIEIIYQKQIDQLYDASLALVDPADQVFLNSINDMLLVRIAAELSSPFLTQQTFECPSFPNSRRPADQLGMVLEPRTVVEIPTKYGLLDVFENDLISQFLEKYGEWSLLETSLIGTFVSGKTVFDIGCYLGTFTLAMQEYKPKFVLAVDANPNVYPILCRNLARNARIPFATLNRAIGIEGVEFSAAYVDPMNLGSFSLAQPAMSQDNLRATLLTPISLATLRADFGDYEVLKLDVEGIETAVLQSDAQWIEENKPLIWCECNESPRSLELFDTLKSFGYEIYFYRYRAYNVDNFNGSMDELFPFAHEAGLLAMAPGSKLPLFHEEVIMGNVRKITTRAELRRELWLTPRWGMSEWEGLSKIELIAMCSRLASRNDFQGFLGQDILNDYDPGIALDMISRKVGTEKSRFYPVPTSQHLIFEHWMSGPIESFLASQLIEGALYLDVAATSNSSKGVEKLAIQQWQRGLKMLERWMNENSTVPDWMVDNYQRYLLDCSNACSRVALILKNDNDLSAAHYWLLATTLLERSLETKPSLNAQDWRQSALERQYLEGAVVFDRIASSYKDNKASERLMADAWNTGADLIRKLLLIAPEQPQWLHDNYQKQLLEGGFACDRFARSLGAEQEEQQATYWYQGAEMLMLLCEAFPAQPDWVRVCLKQQNLEGGVVADRLAVAAQKNGDDRTAGYFWGRGSQMLNALLTHAPEQPAWVADLLRKQLLEGGLAVNRLTQNT